MRRLLMKGLIKIPENLIYPVRKVPTEEITPGIITNSYNSHAVVVETPQGLLKVNDCSKDYQLIRNEAIIRPIIEDLGKRHKIFIQGLSWHDAVFNISIAVDKELGKVEVDKLYPMIRLLNSYNGKIRAVIDMGIWRGVCTNGLTVPEGFNEFREYSHTPSNEEHLAVGQILETFERFLEHTDDVLDVYDDLKSSPVSNISFRVEEVIENTNFPAKFGEDVADRINFEAAKFHLRQTDWLVYNGFNFQLNHHEELVWDPKKRAKADREILTYLLEN
jgi:hypothetical protein